jgi:hypothetical protein
MSSTEFHQPTEVCRWNKAERINVNGEFVELVADGGATVIVAIRLASGQWIERKA